MQTLTALTLTLLLLVGGCGTSNGQAGEATGETTDETPVEDEWSAYYAQALVSSDRVTEMYEQVATAAGISGARAASLCEILTPEAEDLADDFLGSPDPELNQLAELWRGAYLNGWEACAEYQFGIATDAFGLATDYMEQMTAVVEGRAP